MRGYCARASEGTPVGCSGGAPTYELEALEFETHIFAEGGHAPPAAQEPCENTLCLQGSRGAHVLPVADSTCAAGGA